MGAEARLGEERGGGKEQEVGGDREEEEEGRRRGGDREEEEGELMACQGAKGSIILLRASADLLIASETRQLNTSISFLSPPLRRLLSPALPPHPPSSSPLSLGYPPHAVVCRQLLHGMHEPCWVLIWQLPGLAQLLPPASPGHLHCLPPHANSSQHLNFLLEGGRAT